jgi:hypothetical protein
MAEATVGARVVFIYCATPKCDCILGQRQREWRGAPLWIKCRKCGHYNRIATDGVRIVKQAGGDA